MKFEIIRLFLVKYWIYVTVLSFGIPATYKACCLINKFDYEITYSFKHAKFEERNAILDSIWKDQTTKLLNKHGDVLQAVAEKSLPKKEYHKFYKETLSLNDSLKKKTIHYPFYCQYHAEK